MFCTLIHFLGGNYVKAANTARMGVFIGHKNQKECVMKNTIRQLGIIASVVVIGILLASCASAPVRTMPSIPDSTRPARDETEVVIQNFESPLNKANILLNVSVDGVLVAQVSPNSSERIIVKNGAHYIYATEANKRGFGPSVDFVADGEKIIFNVQKLLGMVNLIDQAERERSSSAAQ